MRQYELPVLCQASALAEEIIKTEYDAARIIYNRFQSAISFKPTMVERSIPFSRLDEACILVRSISIGLTATAATTRATDPAANGAYASLIR